MIYPRYPEGFRMAVVIPVVIPSPNIKLPKQNISGDYLILFWANISIPGGFNHIKL